jgi:hypothetical protein
MRSLTFRSVVILAAASWASALAWASPAPTTLVFRTVALSNTQAPGAPDGANFGGFSIGSALNSAGGAAFVATLQTGAGGVDTSNNLGIWSERAGSLALVARRGSQAPGAPLGANFDVFAFPALNASGRTAFLATLQTTGGGVSVGNHQGIWSEGAGSLRLVARLGSQAPGMPAGAHFSSFTSSGVLNSAGRTAFAAQLSTGGGGIWSERTGALALVARAGSQAPGTPVGAHFGAFNSRPALNASGRTAFAASLLSGGGGVTSDNGEGIWSEGSGSLKLVAREGSQAPGTPAGVNFGSFLSVLFPSPVLNAVGRTAFIASLQTGGGVNSNNDDGIWSEGSVALGLVAREGSHAPDTAAGAKFGFFYPPMMNAVGHTAFRALLQTIGGGVTSANNEGIWSEGSGTLSLVAREGSQAPGIAVGGSFSSFSRPALNSSGRAAFFAFLQVSGGDVTADNDHGLWAQNNDGALTLVARKGDHFEVAPGDCRTIASLYFNDSSAGEDGGGVAFNDDSSLVFGAFFSDGTSGVFTAKLPVPEPRTSFLVVHGVVGVCAVQRLRRRRALDQ